MDPNTLDPKLKATYDRVMGTPTVPGQQPAATPPNAVNPVVATTPVQTDQTQQPVSPIPQPAYTADNLSFQAAIQAPVVAGGQVAPTAQQVPQPTSTLLKFLYIVGAMIFFVVYALVWVKIFNLPLPF